MNGDTAPGPRMAPVTTRVLVSGAVTGGRLAIVETLEPRGGEPPCHCHRHEDETLYVLEGMIAILCGGEWLYAPAGTLALLPRNVEHTFAVLTEAARLLTIITPAGLENWYLEGGEARWWGDLDLVVTAAARYGCEITGPHPGLSRRSLSNPVVKVKCGE
jgi:quercetin dioxygenase-like cupin family protein